MYEVANLQLYGSVCYPQCPPGVGIPIAQPDPIYQKELALIKERTEAELYKINKRAEVALRSDEYLLKLHEDIKLEASCLSEAFSFTEDGGIERRQEFLLKKPKQYSSANFKLLSAHRLCDPEGISPSVLQIEIRLENGLNRTVFIDIGRGSGRYYARKLREAGARLKLKRGENNDAYESFLLAVMQVSKDCILPENHGFYRVDDRLCYAGKNDVTFQEVKDYVK